MAEVEFAIAGRQYRVACRSGEEESLRAAATLVDEKSREALAGLGTLSEARQFFFAALLLADQLVDKKRLADGGGPAPVPGEAAAPPAPLAPSPAASPDPAVARRVAALAGRLEFLAEALEDSAANP